MGVGAATLGVGHKKAVISASTPTSGDRIIPTPTSTNNDTSTSTKKVAASPTERREKVACKQKKLPENCRVVMCEEGS